MSEAGQIVYNSINVDFERPWNAYKYQNIQRQTATEMASGVVHSANYYDSDYVIAQKNKLTAHEAEQLLRFYEYAKDGSTFTFVRDRGLGTAIGFEGKSLKDIDENTLTFTRSHTANTAGYLDPSTGLYTWIGAADTARFPAGKYSGGVIVEPARENLCGRSESLDHGDYTPTNITVAANTSESNFIDGNATAERLTITNATNSLVYSTGTAVSTNDGVNSLWLRSRSGSVSSTLRLTSTTGAFNADQAITITPSWQNFYSIFESPSSQAGNWRFNLMNTDNAAVIYAGGVQIEVGSGVLFPSQYIKSDAGGTVTRPVEDLSDSSTNIVSETKGTMGLWFYPRFVYDETDGVYLMCFGVPAGGNVGGALRIDSSGNLIGEIYRADGTAIQASGSLSSMNQDSFDNHAVMTWDTTISNGIKIHFNGALLATSSNSAFTPRSDHTFYFIGHDNNSGNHCGAVISDPFIRKDVRSAANINHIYNSAIGLGEQKNRFTGLRLVTPQHSPVKLVGVNRYGVRLVMGEGVLLPSGAGISAEMGVIG